MALRASPPPRLKASEKGRNRPTYAGANMGHPDRVVSSGSDRCIISRSGVTGIALQTWAYPAHCDDFDAQLLRSLEARVGIEPTHKGFADPEEAPVNPFVFTMSSFASPIPVRFWSAFDIILGLVSLIRPIS